jgi:hypothetical protein
MLTTTATSDRPIFTSERATHVDKTVTAWQQQQSCFGPQMGVETKTYWLTDLGPQCIFDLTVSKGSMPMDCGHNCRYWQLFSYLLSP